MNRFALVAIFLFSPFFVAFAAQPPENKKGETAGRKQTQAKSKISDDSSAGPKDHRWLKQLVGEWDGNFKMYMQPDQPPAETKGTDSVRALGDHWVTADTRTTMMGTPFDGILSLGYDAQTKQFNGTWIDSMSGYLWVYKGRLNDVGDTLTLETKGPSMNDLNETTNYREVITIKDKDHRTFTSNIELEDGKWTKILEVDYRRKPDHAPARSAKDTKDQIRIHYLEIVTPDIDTTCNLLAKANGVSFGKPVAEFGNARTAKLNDGGRIGVRGPMGAEKPVVRSYVLVDDIHAAVRAAEDSGASILMHPTEIPGQGTFAIYLLGNIEHGLWKL